MEQLHMGAAEGKFADLIWENEPIASGQLAKLSESALGWKKTTSFTVLKRLCDREIFQNTGGIVTSLISRDAYYAQHSKQYVDENFGGSLPAFLAAFGSTKKLSQKEYDEMMRLIEQMRR